MLGRLDASFPVGVVAFVVSTVVDGVVAVVVCALDCIESAGASVDRTDVDVGNGDAEAV